MPRHEIKANIFESVNIPSLKESVLSSDCGFFDSKFNSDEYFIFPGFCDVHVHFREPGFSYKETILTGSAASARGGYTDVCTMPNLNPVPDSLPHLQEQLDIIKRDACIGVHPYGASSVGEMCIALAKL